MKKKIKKVFTKPVKIDFYTKGKKFSFKGVRTTTKKPIKKKKLKAWAMVIINKECKIPIPNIQREIDHTILYPWAIFRTKELAKMAKRKAKEKYPDQKYKIARIKIEILQ